ncbi:hypothetical protein BKA70DRAFT_1522716 [Coprinopsis sp. MPI-PUGE-AT-0042]|nr:hypothetical protein BKA70DRAFT_1522716 [Coprinopsis sp. MPI-PUGE-AT-0042]
MAQAPSLRYQHRILAPAEAPAEARGVVIVVVQGLVQGREMVDQPSNTPLSLSRSHHSPLTHANLAGGGRVDSRPLCCSSHPGVRRGAGVGVEALDPWQGADAAVEAPDQQPTILVQPSQGPPTVYLPPQAVPTVVPGMLPVGPAMMQQPPLVIQRSHSSSLRSVRQATPAPGATVLPPQQQPQTPPTMMPPTIVQGDRSYSRESRRSRRSRSPRHVEGVPVQTPSTVVCSVTDSPTPDALGEPIKPSHAVTDWLTATAVSESVCLYPSGIIESHLESHEDQCLSPTGDSDLDRFFGLSCSPSAAEESHSEVSGKVVAVLKEASCVEISGGLFNNAGNDIHHYQTDQQVHYYSTPLPPVRQQKGPGKESKNVWPMALLNGPENIIELDFRFIASAVCIRYQGIAGLRNSMEVVL